MKRGPKPKPTKLKKLEGVRTDRINENEPQPGAGKVTCPGFLSKEAKAEWRRIAPELTRLGLLTPLDRAAFAAYCESYARWVRAEILLEKGIVVRGSKGQMIVSPLVWISTSASKMMLKFAIEFGLTPSSRSRLVGGIETRERDPMDELLGTTRNN